MELENIKIGNVKLERLNRFKTNASEISIIRIFDLNNINYISFVDIADGILKTLSAKEFEYKFGNNLNTLFIAPKIKKTDDSDCECTNCKL